MKKISLLLTKIIILLLFISTVITFVAHIFFDLPLILLYLLCAFIALGFYLLAMYFPPEITNEIADKIKTTNVKNLELDLNHSSLMFSWIGAIGLAFLFAGLQGLSAVDPNPALLQVILGLCIMAVAQFLYATQYLPKLGLLTRVYGAKHDSKENKIKRKK